MAIARLDAAALFKKPKRLPVLPAQSGAETRDSSFEGFSRRFQARQLARRCNHAAGGKRQEVIQRASGNNHPRSSAFIGG